MPFLRGTLSFERYTVSQFDANTFDDEHIEALQNHAASDIRIGQATSSDAAEDASTGFLGGDHLFDQIFELGKNVINDAVHASIRVDTDQIPSAIRNAWLQIELAARAKDSPNGTVSKADRQEAKEAVEERCRVEMSTGKYRKMACFAWLWDLRSSVLNFAGSGNAGALCADLVEQVFGVEVRRLTAGKVAQQWASAADRYAQLDDLVPATFVPGQGVMQMPWTNEHSQAPDFLGNEFLLWLWWRLEHESDTLVLADETEVAVMLLKTLTLECPLGESGKETISAEFPTQLPEAQQAVRSGKLPRKIGMVLVRQGLRFELVLQAESFAISGAKIISEDEEPLELDERIDAIRSLSETVDRMFHVFCDRRTSAAWDHDLTQMQQWLEAPTANRKQQQAA